MTTTVMHDQSARDYHAMPGASASRLKLLKRSAAHMKHDMDNPQEPTQAMIIGSATHSAILEPVLFVKEWGRLPEGDGRSKAVKQAKAELISEFGADHILKPDAYDNILAMRDSVFGNALALDLLDGADTETSHYWTQNGVACKARIDALPREDSPWNDCVVDIKTTANAHPDEFRRSVFNFSYHIQARHYLSAAERDRFIFIVVERDAPHCVAIYELDEAALELGRQDREFLLGQWALCEAEQAAGGPDAWPGFPIEIQELSLPGWAYTR
jgi:exodeoxyribonuclease VIII